MPDIHVFGRPDSPATRAALRFFRERRIAVHSSDLRKRPIAAGELQRFVQGVGARALLDVDARAYRDKGLAHMRLDNAEIVARLLADANLLRLPLIRFGSSVTVGTDEATWTAWLKPTGGS
jgi:arsenate reductase